MGPGSNPRLMADEGSGAKGQSGRLSALGIGIGEPVVIGFGSRNIFVKGHTKVVVAVGFAWISRIMSDFGHGVVKTG